MNKQQTRIEHIVFYHLTYQSEKEILRSEHNQHMFMNSRVFIPIRLRKTMFKEFHQRTTRYRETNSNKTVGGVQGHHYQMWL